MAYEKNLKMEEDEKLWQQDWDDEEADEEFIKHLRAELASNSK